MERQELPDDFLFAIVDTARVAGVRDSVIDRFKKSWDDERVYPALSELTWAIEDAGGVFTSPDLAY